MKEDIPTRKFLLASRRKRNVKLIKHEKISIQKLAIGHGTLLVMTPYRVRHSTGIKHPLGKIPYGVLCTSGVNHPTG